MEEILHHLGCLPYQLIVFFISFSMEGKRSIKNGSVFWTF